LIPRAAFFSSAIDSDEYARPQYFSEAFQALQSADLLFFDPDNGIEVRSCPQGGENSHKYIYWNEVDRAFKEFHKSLLIYQHFPRENRKEFIARRREDIKARTGMQDVYAFKTPHVAFFLVMQPRHRKLIEPRIKDFEKSPWGVAEQIVLCRD
jgi:hypothetical protein